jgi:hypothetical protein
LFCKLYEHCLLSVHFLQLFRLITAMDSDNYPECCHAIYIVNGGMAFGAIWRMVSPFVDKGTRDKVHVLGSGRIKPVLAKVCGGIDKVPDFLGGGLDYEATKRTWLAEMDRIMAAKAAAAAKEAAVAKEAAAAVAGNGLAPPAAGDLVTAPGFVAAVEPGGGPDLAVVAGQQAPTPIASAPIAAAAVTTGAVVAGAAAADRRVQEAPNGVPEIAEKVAEVPLGSALASQGPPPAAAAAEVPQQLSAGSSDGVIGARHVGQQQSVAKAAMLRAAALEPPKGLAEIKARKDSGGDSFADADDFSTPKSHMSRSVAGLGFCTGCWHYCCHKAAICDVLWHWVLHSCDLIEQL